jgi:hypothetical protein
MTAQPCDAKLDASRALLPAAFFLRSFPSLDNLKTHSRAFKIADMDVLPGVTNYFPGTLWLPDTRRKRLR